MVCGGAVVCPSIGWDSFRTSSSERTSAVLDSERTKPRRVKIISAEVLSREV